MKSPLNILFINIPPVCIDMKHQSDNTVPFYVFPPMGIVTLALQLYGKEYVGKIELLDFGLFDFSEFTEDFNYTEFIHAKIKEKSKNTVYDIISISVKFSSSHDFFEIVVNEAHSIFHESFIICGGVHATVSTEFILNNIEHVDYIIRGEGEISLPLLLREIHSQNTLKSLHQFIPNIPGVIHKESCNVGANFSSAHCLTVSELSQDIDINYNLYPKILDLDCYTSRLFLFNLNADDIHTKAFPVMASRGCPVRCTFCAVQTVSGTKPRWRTINNVREEIMWLHRQYGVTRIHLMDDNFVPKKKAIELFEMLCSLPIENLDVVIQNMSVNHTSFEIIDLIAKARIKTITFAIESGSVEMQKKINKRCDLDKAKELVEYAQQKGLSVRCFYMIGFPGETLSQMHETIEVAEKIGADWSSFFVATPYPGTKMYDEFIALGCIQDSPEFWSVSTIRNRVFDTDEFSAEELKKLAYEANLKVNFVNSPYITKKEYQKGKVIFENFVSIYKYHILAYDCLRRINLELGNVSDAESYMTIMKNKLRDDKKSAHFKQYLYLLDEKVVTAITEQNV